MAKKKKIIVTLNETDFRKYSNDQELGKFARGEYLKQVDKSLVDPKDYGKYNWVYPGPTKM